MSGDSVKRRTGAPSGGNVNAKPSEPPKGPVTHVKELGSPRAWTPGNGGPKARPAGWASAAPSREEPPPPPPTPEVIGGVRVASKEEQAAAAAELRRTLALVTANPAIQRKLLDEKVAVVVIPMNMKLTDVPQFQSLKGQSTFDGRPWDTVRGVGGGIRLRDGSYNIGIAEETLLHHPPDTYPPGYNLGMHEIAHVIQDLALNRGDTKAVSDAFKARTQAKGPWTDTYASNNEREYFAQATTCYFGENDGEGATGADWLQTNDPAMYAIMQRVYGPAPAPAPVPGG